MHGVANGVRSCELYIYVYGQEYAAVTLRFGFWMKADPTHNRGMFSREIEMICYLELELSPCRRMDIHEHCVTVSVFILHLYF